VAAVHGSLGLAQEPVLACAGAVAGLRLAAGDHAKLGTFVGFQLVLQLSFRCLELRNGEL